MSIAATRTTWLAILVFAATSAGLVLVLHGLLRIGFPFDLPWTRPGLYRLLGLLAATLLALACVSRLLRLSPAGAAALVAASTLAMLGALWPVLLIGAFALAATLVGRRLRRLWRDSAPEHADPLIDVVLGAGAYATVVSVLAHWPINNTAVYAALLAVPIAIDRHAALELLRTPARALRDPAPQAPFAAWLGTTLAVVYVIVALFPEIGWDSLTMHLFIPSHLAVHRFWHFDPTRFAWSLMPALGDWLFAIIFMFDGERGTRLLNAGCAILVAGFVYRIAALCGANRAWSWFAAALWLATPVMFTVGSSLFIDAEWALFLLVGLFALLRPPLPGQPPYGWVTAAALIGFSAAAKAVTLPLLPVLGLAVLAQRDILTRRGIGRVLPWAALAFVAAAAKPYITAWLLTGNPVYPFYVHLFGGPQFDFWTSGPGHFRRPLSWTMIYDATFSASNYIEGRTGAPGFQWLMLLPAAAIALVATRHRRGLMLLLLGVAMTFAVFVFQTYLRYLIPALAVLVAAIAVAGTALRGLTRSGSLVLAGSGAAALVLNVCYMNAASFYRTFPLETVANEQARQRFIAEVLPARTAAEFAARMPAAGSRLAMFSAPAFAVVPQIDVVHPSWYVPPFFRAVQGAQSPEALARTLLEWQIRYVVLDSWWSHPEHRRLLEQATVPLVEFQGAAVREIPREHLFQAEYLKNPQLAEATGWTLAAGARHDALRKALVVSADAPAYQPVPVVPGNIYRNAVRARCAGSGLARVQVNWLDARQNFISTSLQVFACADEWTERVQEVVAPPKAAVAIVYASGGTSSPIEVGAVSFRGRMP